MSSFIPMIETGNFEQCVIDTTVSSHCVAGLVMQNFLGFFNSKDNLFSDGLLSTRIIQLVI